MAFYPANIQNAISGATRNHSTRATYQFIGPDSPANRRYPLNDVEGLDSSVDVGARWWPLANVNLGTPAVASTTYVVNAATVSAAGNATLNSTNEETITGLAGGALLVVTDYPRALQYVSSNAGDTTQTVTVTGYDQYKSLQTELITLNGTTPVLGLKAFVYIQSVAVSATMAGTLSVGTQNVFGLPMAVDAGDYEAAVKVVSGAQTADAGTLVFADRTSPATSTTGDVRGTYAPAATPNGSTTFRVRYFPALGPHLKTTSTYGVQTA